MCEDGVRKKKERTAAKYNGLPCICMGAGITTVAEESANSYWWYRLRALMLTTLINELLQLNLTH